MSMLADIQDALRKVYDPEISVNVFDLGLIYEIDLKELPKVTVTHTLTSAFCPAADDIIRDIQDAVCSIEGVDTCDIITTFDPPFGPWAMSEDVKLTLGIWE
jgi:metal-sulfur cluster biosynthetic enzyme